MKELFLKPGEIFVSKTPTRVTTILGSCISVCLFDPVTKLGGICHYYLPEATGASEASNNFGDVCIKNLLKEFKNNGAHPKNIEAKVIGGAAVNQKSSESSFFVGVQNTHKAFELLSQFKIKVVSKETGGDRGRKVQFEIHTGRLRFKKVSEFPQHGVVKAKPTAATISQSTADQQTHLEKDPNRKIKVMIVDDSKSMRKILRTIINTSSNFEILHEAASGPEALDMIAKDKPDVITLDINMPEMNGVEVLKRYMSTCPIPTIMVTSLNHENSGPVFESLECGAFDYIKKPDFSEIESMTAELCERIEAAFLARSHMSIVKQGPKETAKIELTSTLLDRYTIVIGASTGGTEAIKEVLTRLPENIPAILITQHIPPVFSKALANRLNQLCPFTVCEAIDGLEVKSQNVYIAPGGAQMKLDYDKDGKRIIRITDDPPVNRFKPSVDYLFNSVAEKKAYSVVAVLLTGMGSDGAKGLLALKNQGASTIAQDEETSVVYGMPKVAKELGAVDQVVSLYDVSRRITDLLNRTIQKSPSTSRPSL